MSRRIMGTLQYKVLNIIKDKSCEPYGTALCEYLSKELDSEVSKALIYRVLATLESRQYIILDATRFSEAPVSGKPRKFYVITDLGKEKIVDYQNRFHSG